MQCGSPPALLESVALPVHLQHVNAVSKAVQQGSGQPIRAEDLGPLVEGQVGGDQDRPSLVSLTEDLEDGQRKIVALIADSGRSTPAESVLRTHSLDGRLRWGGEQERTHPLYYRYTRRVYAVQPGRPSGRSFAAGARAASPRSSSTAPRQRARRYPPATERPRPREGGTQPARFGRSTGLSYLK